MEEILDASLLLEQCDMKVMLKMGQLSLRCVARSLKCCPVMSEVVQELEDALRSADNSFIPTESPSITFGTWTLNMTKIWRSMDDQDLCSLRTDRVGYQKFHVEMDSVSYQNANLRCLQMNSISIDVDVMSRDRL